MFSDQTVIVTGGANGIGLATVKAFLEKNARVVMADIVQEAGQRAQKELAREKDNCLFIPTDTGCESSVQQMVQQAMQTFGPISVLVNGAACFIMKGVEATPQDWEQVCRVGIAGYALCAKHVVPSMKEIGGGAIVNICSISALIAQPHFVTYSATKGAVLSMTRCMALDLAKDNIRVNAVSPGTIWTESNERFHRETLKMNRAQADHDPDIGGKHMLKRTGDPHEVAEAILFLASNKARFITGDNVCVDGGYTAQ
ncbi:SDR family NAD(P)-dependent oxidoreductase [Candidatus Hepatobacter penaei]|uniref:SDR family NAD(P)-dependent oxidoreductase n=1 Tax=Candidatus Hepatobacter penaei TaxID=1274402 RepID=UPI0004F388FA|nr:SDR family oxidoreductase [Candidatus Hepatobacter penaei]